MIRRLLLVAALAFFSTQYASAQVKIGYANPDIIMSELQEVKKLGEEIRLFVEQKDAMLKPKADSLQAQIEAYEKIMATLSNEAKQARESELIALNEQFEATKQASYEEIQQRQIALLGPIQDKVNKAIADVAKELGLDLVLSDVTSEGGEIIFYAAENQPNITQKVLQKLQ
tara:strand:- start:28366 stop:28881 length:516 start_codon:yes stop_codon:yes gene_type:complete